MRAGLGHLPARQHHDTIGVLHGAEPVCDHERGAVLHQLAHRILYVALGLGVERRGGFVEHQDRRVLVERACDGDALALAAGKTDALGADVGVEPRRQALDEFEHVRRTRRFVQPLFVHRAGRTVGDVVTDGVVEQQRFLAHERKVRAQVGELEIVQIDAIEQDRAPAHLIEARQQTGAAGLAAARGADERDRLPRFDGERHAIKRVHGRRRIAEAYVAVFDFPLHGFQLDGSGIRLRRLVDQAKHALRRCQAGLDDFIHLRQALGRIDHGADGSDERHERAGGDRAEIQRHVNHERQGQRGNELDNRHADGRYSGLAQCFAPVHLIDRGECGDLACLGPKRLDHALALRRLLCHLRDFTHARLDAVRNLSKAPAHGTDQHRRHRRQHQENQRQFPIEMDHPRQQRQHREPVADNDEDGIGDGVGNLADVEQQLRDQHTRRVQVVERARQARQVREDGVADVGNDALTDPTDGVLRQKIAEAAQDEQTHQRERDELDDLGAAVDEALIHQRLHQRRETGGGGREHDRPEHRQQEHTLVRPGVLEQAAVEPPIALAVGGQTHGAATGCWVANDSREKPSRRAASITRTTASCGALPSAWITTNGSLLLPAAAASA